MARPHLVLRRIVNLAEHVDVTALQPAVQRPFGAAPEGFFGATPRGLRGKFATLPSPPRIRLLANDGTIAGAQTCGSSRAYAAAKFSIDALITAVPQLATLARLDVEQVAALGLTRTREPRELQEMFFAY